MKQLDTPTVPMAISNALGFAFLPLLVSPLVAWLYALWVDILHNHWERFVADAVFVPLGIIHGIILLFSN
jgi:hypothetical protein